jgi:uncharacterized membrane protein YdjX (TVP38/TMEM64 family)
MVRHDDGQFSRAITMNERLPVETMKRRRSECKGGCWVEPGGSVARMRLNLRQCAIFAFVLLLPPLSHAFISPLTQKRGSPSITEKGMIDADVAGGLVNAPSLFDGVLSSISPADHPLAAIVGSYMLVSISDMVPFVPCQPLAIALGAKLGFALAFPITLAGQTTAGILAFSAARRAASSDFVTDASIKLDEETMAKFEEFQRMTGTEENDNRTILLALVGLRLAPFFPFSAGNYLLGGATTVPLPLFAIATLFGCILSNLVSTSVGAGGAVMLQHIQ